MNRASLSVGIVVERREIDHPWQSHTWHTVAVLPGAPERAPWQALDSGPGWVRYHAANLPLELFGKETEGYKYNLSTPVPSVYVVLRAEEGSEHEVTPFLATVSPYEAQDYQDAGDDLVDAVAMSPEIAEWVGAFIERYHKDEPFYKRKRKRHDEDRADSGPPRLKDVP